MNASSPGLYGHQQEPERLAQAIAHIESKAHEVRVNIEQLLFLLDLQEKVPWPDMLDKFASLSSAMTQLQAILKKSALPSGFEDYGFFLRSHVLVPHVLSNEVDINLQEVTNNRLQCWNHDAAPEYLRTKLTPELEAEEAHLDNEKNSRTYEQVNKQVMAMNKHIESLLSSLAENARNQTEIQRDVPTYNDQDTQNVVRAIINGEGLRPTRPSTTNEGQTSAGSTGGGRPPGSMMSPQQRR